MCLLPESALLNTQKHHVLEVILPFFCHFGSIWQSKWRNMIENRLQLSLVALLRLPEVVAITVVRVKRFDCYFITKFHDNVHVRLRPFFWKCRKISVKHTCNNAQTTWHSFYRMHNASWRVSSPCRPYFRNLALVLVLFGAILLGSSQSITKWKFSKSWD